MKKLCFITKSSKFDALCSSFRKLGIDSHKRVVSDDLKAYDVLIVDLGHPLEMAYPLLEKLKKDSYFSDKIVIAAITHKSQILKLRSFALGCDDYISPSIEFNDLLQKIKRLEDPAKFRIRKKFTNQRAEINFEAYVTHISENGCLIKSKVSIDCEEDKMRLESKLLADLNFDSSIHFVISKSNPIARRSFITEVHFSNLSDQDRHKIRKMVHGWSTV